MKYPKEYLNEIKLRLKVSHVVGKSVKLKKRGKEFIGLSPFSSEKTPSFTVNDEKGFYHCFSSGEHGNIFDFLMKTKNYKFGDAVRSLAADAGMQQYRFTKQDEEKQKRWNSYKEILEKYSNFCNEELLSKKYPDVLEYLSQRKISQKEIDFFRIGYSPTNNNFYEKISKEFDQKQIALSGIYYFDEKNKKNIDRFRSRIIFPVINLNNSVIAFGGRTLSKSAFAKYINSPETEFYKKGNNLYNINNAKKTQSDLEVFVVEGYMDVINLHKFGISNVVANLGTAMTERQLDLIWRFFKSPIICLDGDGSGRKAALRAAERLFPEMKPELNISFLTLPENHDPDSYINTNGKDSFLKLKDSKTEIQKFIWDSYYNNVEINNPRSLSIFEKKIKSLCYEMKDKTLSKYFLDYFINKINELTPNIGSKRKNLSNFYKKSNPLQETKKIYKERNKFNERELKEFSILFLIMNNLSIFKKNIELISEIKFIDEIKNDFLDTIIKYMLSEKSEKMEKLTLNQIDQKYNPLINTVNSFAPVKIICAGKKEDSIFVMLKEIINEVKKLDLKEKIHSLEDKVSLNLDEKLYSELLSLRNQLKSG